MYQQLLLSDTHAIAYYDITYMTLIYNTINVCQKYTCCKIQKAVWREILTEQAMLSITQSALSILTWIVFLLVLHHTCRAQQGYV